MVYSIVFQVSGRSACKQLFRLPVLQRWQRICRRSKAPWYVPAGILCDTRSEVYYYRQLMLVRLGDPNFRGWRLMAL